jgi:hypothetical protein
MKDFLLSWPPGQSFLKPVYHSCTNNNFARNKTNQFLRILSYTVRWIADPYLAYADPDPALKRLDPYQDSPARNNAFPAKFILKNFPLQTVC